MMDKKKLWVALRLIFCIIIWGLFAVQCYINSLPSTYRRDDIILESGNKIDTYYEEYLYSSEHSEYDINSINRDVLADISAQAVDYENCSFKVYYGESEWRVYRNHDEFQGFVSAPYLKEQGVESAPFYARKLQTETMLYVQIQDLWHQTVIPNEKIILYQFADYEENIDNVEFYDFPHGDYSGTFAYLALQPVDVDACYLKECGHIDTLTVDEVSYSSFEAFGSTSIYPVKIEQDKVQVNSSLFSELTPQKTDYYWDLTGEDSKGVISALCQFVGRDIDETQTREALMESVFQDWEVNDGTRAMPSVYIDEIDFPHVFNNNQNGGLMIVPTEDGCHITFKLVVQDENLAQSIFSELEARFADDQTRKIHNGEYQSYYFKSWDDIHGDCYVCDNYLNNDIVLRIEPSADRQATVISGVFY